MTQLTRLLRHAETETKVLQEALEGQLDPSCQLMATNWIQEKVSLSQEVTQVNQGSGHLLGTPGCAPINVDIFIRWTS